VLRGAASVCASTDFPRDRALVTARHASSLRGILAMTVGAGLLTITDAISKYLTARYPLGQIVCLRQAAAFLFIVPYAWSTTGLRILKPVSYGGQTLRACLFVIGTALIIVSLDLLPLTLVTVVLFASPLFVAVLSGPMLGERVRAYQWVAVAAGFCGVMMIVRPGAAGFQWIVLLPVMAAFINALRDTVTRHISSTDSSLSMLFWSGMLVLLVSLATLPFAWTPVDAEGVLWFLAVGLCNAAAHFFVIEAFRLGNAAVVAPFRYSGLLWAMLLGFIVWRDVPDVWMLAGAAIVVAAGVYMVKKSSQAAHAASPKVVARNP
jgi:drug/metabolite transporter (DMT)-like permease